MAEPSTDEARISMLGRAHATAEAEVERLSAELDALFAGVVRAKAEAWEKGWEAGCNDQQYGNEDAEPWTPNPYRPQVTL